MTDKKVEEKPKKMEELVLTDSDRALLNMMPKLPSLDKSSQNRLRAKIDARRKASKDFETAFGYSLSSAFSAPRMPQNESIFGSVKDVLSHPIEAVKGKIASSMLKRRNKAPSILVVPDPKLKRVAEPWDFEKGKREDLIEIVRKMGAALRGTKYGDKLGIAAPQIGINKRIFVCQGAVCVNPTFEPPKHRPTNTGVEGCYSVPGKLYKVDRIEYGWARWFSIDGTPREFKLKGKDAIVFQHELDHLDGKCCCDTGVEYTPQEHLEGQAKA